MKSFIKTQEESFAIKYPKCFKHTRYIIMMLVFASIVRCSKADGTETPSPETTFYTVTFSAENSGAGIPDQKVEKGKLATQPQDPIREGFTFKGWLSGAALFNFNTPITTNITLKASWEENETDPDPNAALLPSEYVQHLGKGFDVTWSEFSKYMDLYKEQVVIDFKEAGFSSVRIRMDDENLDATFLANLKKQVDDCIANGIYPILAYQGHYIEDMATSNEDAKQHLTAWWRKMAETFQGYSDMLSFNILVEISGTYKDDYTSINDFYTSVLAAIRETNPKRIVIFPPVKISDPENLHYLEIPNNDPYSMAEWHFYAAGPSKVVGNKKYWNDGSTKAERDNIIGPIQTAVQWMNQTGRVTWVGAWMAGNYNKGNEYSIPEQVAFATYMVRQLDKEKIPWCINAGNKYYDYETNQWFTENAESAGIPVRDVILDTEKISLYEGDAYAGASYRLGAGSYTKADLENLGINGTNIKSMMVPFDYQVKIYTQDNFQGTPTAYTQTLKGLTTTITSMQVVNQHHYD